MSLISHRDDGFKLWDALHNYVEGVVNSQYGSDQVNLTTYHLAIPVT